jgi:predicted methyltransferase
MFRTSILAAGTLLLTGALAEVGAAHPAGVPPYIAAAVADKARPEADTQRDADRKPAETLAFAGVKPGEQVAELVPGGGYFTRLLSAVVGPKGKVYALANPKRPDAAADAPEPAARLAPITSDPHYANVAVSTLSIRATPITFPQNVDLVWTSQNYHDFHNVKELDVADLDKAVFNALKPGGIYIVLDHAAEAGSGFRDTSTLHRIDEAAVKQEVEAVGFKFVGASDVLRNKDDPHTDKVFDGAIRGHTDQFILKFQKPK